MRMVFWDVYVCVCVGGGGGGMSCDAVKVMPLYSMTEGRTSLKMDGTGAQKGMLGIGKETHIWYIILKKERGNTLFVFVVCLFIL